MIIYYLCIYAIGIGVMIYFKRETAKFLARYPAISDRVSLDAFRRMARRNMIIALPYAVFMIVGLALGLNLLMQNLLAGLVVVLIANIPFFFVTQSMRRLEIRSRELPCDEAALAVEYNRISRSWLQDFWPKFRNAL